MEEERCAQWYSKEGERRRPVLGDRGGSVAAALVGVLLEEDLVDQEDAAEDARLGVGLRVARELDLEGVRVGEELVLEAGPHLHDAAHLSRDESINERAPKQARKDSQCTLLSFVVDATVGG